MGLGGHDPATGAKAVAKVRKAADKMQAAGRPKAAKAKVPAAAKAKRQQAPAVAGIKRELSRSRSLLLETQGLVKVNRAPVLTLWMETCLRRLGSSEETALTAAKVITGRCAVAKGRALGRISPAASSSTSPAVAVQKKPASKAAPDAAVRIAGQTVPLAAAAPGACALGGDGSPLEPEAVRRYLRGAFGGSLDGVRAAMRETAGSYDAAELRESAMSLYERFRPAWRGWGVPGELHLGDIRAAAAAGQ